MSSEDISGSSSSMDESDLWTDESHANEATMSSEDIFGSSSSMDESDLWTEESDVVSSSFLEDYGVNALGA